MGCLSNEAHQKCPHCGQLMKIYRRAIRVPMLICLKHLWAMGAYPAYVKAREIPGYDGGGDFAKLRFWGLIEEGEPLHWRITYSGLKFLSGDLRVSKYRWVYDNKIQPDPEGQTNELISIVDVAPELMDKNIALENAVNFSPSKQIEPI